MTQYDIDFEILYSIKEGNYSFSQIWKNVKGIGSKQTFSNHLSQLVDSGNIVKRDNENGKQEYHLSTDQVLIDVKENGILSTLEEEIKNLEEKSKKKTDKKLLKEFVENTRELMEEYSHIHTQNLLLESFDSLSSKPSLGLGKKELEKIDEFLKKQIEILKNRDEELFELYLSRFG